MAAIKTEKERFEDIERKARMKRSEDKKKPPKTREKNKLLLQLTIPSRRGRRKT
jgi:hypothetical protein